MADKSQAVIIMALKTEEKLVSSLEPSPGLLQAHAPPSTVFCPSSVLEWVVVAGWDTR